MKYLKAAYLETRALYDRIKAAQQPDCGNTTEPSASDYEATPSERQSRTRWQFWNSVAEVMNAPSNVDVAWFVCHTNRVLWSMASQGYRREDGVAFLDEVANSGRFPDSYIKKARRSLDKYWKTK